MEPTPDLAAVFARHDKAALAFSGGIGCPERPKPGVNPTKSAEKRTSVLELLLLGVKQK